MLKFLKGHQVWCYLCLMIVLIALGTAGAVYHVQNQKVQNTPTAHISKIGWHKGMPAVLNDKKLWASPKVFNQSKKHYDKLYTLLSSQSSFNPFRVTFNNHHQIIAHGNVDSATLGQHPYTKVVGNHTYAIISGNPTLTKDLENVNGDTHHHTLLTQKLTVQVLDSNDVKIYSDTQGQKSTGITFQPSSQSLKQVLHNR